jgi:hypothetical protein
MAVDVGARGSTQGLRVAKKPVPKPKATQTRRKVSSSSRSSGGGTNYRSSGNSSNRSSGGGGGGGGSYSPPKQTKPKPPPSVGQYLGGDSAYQNSVRGSKRSLTDFLSEIGRRRGEAGTQFTQTTAGMERDRVRQLDELRQEFASRGLIQSGLFGEEQGKFQQQFTDQMTALQQQQAALLADLLGQEKNYKRESDLANEQAKQEALLRRAQKYKIGA